MKRHIYIVILLVMVFSCSKEDSGDSNSPNSKQEYSAEIAGAIAKGAYKAGSDITFYELNDNLSQTGKSFSTNTTDDYGTFSLSVESITENYARVEGNGYYWNEITNTVTEQKLRLNAICEVNDEINLNILTHLEYDRVIELVQNQGKTFAEAKTQALSEVLSSFGLEYDSSNGNAEAYNFNKADDSSKLLLLVSVAILYNSTQAEISSLISNISNDLKDNGQINENNINKHLIDNLRELKAGVVKVIENEEGEIEHSFSFNLIAQNVYEFYKDSDTEIQTSSYDVSTLVDDAIQVLSEELPDQDNDGIPDIYDLCPETPEGEVTNLNGCHDFIYLAENGVTVKARETALVGDKKEINGIEYEVVNREILIEKIKNKQDITSVITSFIKIMNGLFRDYDRDFNQDLSSWDVSNVENFNGTFAETKYFNQDISSWDTSNTITVEEMFLNAEKFNQDLSRWCVNKIIVNHRFNEGAVNFDEFNLPQWGKCPLPYEIDKDDDGVPDSIDNCPDTRNNVPVDDNGCEVNPLYIDENGITIKANVNYAVIGQSYELNGQTYKVVDEQMLRDLVSKNEEVSNIVTTFVYDMNSLFRGKEYFNKDISSWDVSNVSRFTMMFDQCKVFNQNIGYWDTSNATEIGGMFMGAHRFNQNINNWDVSNVISMWRVFDNAYNFNQPLDKWDTSNVKNFSGLFMSATSFNQSLNEWDTSNVTEMIATFVGATSFNQPLNNWDTSKVENMRSLFDCSMNFNQDISSWDVSNVTDMNRMFGCYGSDNKTKFNHDISTWDVSKVFNMEYMFAKSEFNQDISSWDVSNVGNMNFMFIASLFNQDLSNWDVSNVYYCGFFWKDNSSWTEPKPNFTNCDPDEF